MNRLRQMSQDVADAVRAAVDAEDALAGACRVTVLVEDRLTAGFTVDEALGRNGVCVVAGVTGFERRANAGALVFGTARFDVSVFENPAFGRETADAPTAQTVAELVMERLHWLRPAGWDAPLRLRSMARADEPPYVVARLEFAADATLGAAGRISDET